MTTNRRLALAILLFLAACLCPSAHAAEQPNVLLILADDLGYSDLGCFGSEIPTPNIDRLAARGLRFTQCYNSARCCPSRASLVTGLYPHQAGIGSFTTAKPDRARGPAYLGHLNDRCVTLAEVLGEAGYRTYMVGKWHMGDPGPIRSGFDEFYGFVNGYSQDQWSPEKYVRLPEGRKPELHYKDGEFYATDVFTDYALEFLKQARKGRDRPWLLYLAQSSPHFPVQAPAASVERFVKTYRRGWDVLRAERFQRQKRIGLASDSWTLTDRSLVPVDDPKVTNGFGGRPNPAWADLPKDRREDLAHRMAIFAAMVSHVDQGIGRIVADLKANGELDNTLILFLSDNGACYEWGPFGFDGPSRTGKTTLHTGEALRRMGGPGTYHAYGSAWANLCNTPLRMYKHFTHEGGICTPLIVHWPKGVTRDPGWVRDPVHLIDIMPTLCEVAGAKYPTDHRGHAILPREGKSLLPVFRGKALPERSLAFEHQNARAIRKGKWKAVWGKRQPDPVRWELYDLSRDRCETKDLAREKPELTAELAAEWLAWARRVKVYPFYKGKDATPLVANRQLAISCRVTVPDGKSEGVILAHGGNQHGYALHVRRKELYFSVRIRKVVASIHAPIPTGRAAKVTARLLAGGRMTLSIDGKQVAEGKAAGLIPVEPIDGLSVGFDDRSAVGDYKSPFKFDGVVEDVRVERTARRVPPAPR
jgi:arylsulfatase A-like enzyme